MKLNTPLVTLLGGAVLGVGVLVTSMVWSSGTSSASTSASGYGATSAASAATTVTLPLAGSSSPAAAPATTTATSPATAPASAPGTSPATSSATAPAPATAPAATASANQGSAPPKADYVGQVNGGGASVAVSVHGNKAVAYICNGHAVAAWVKGSAENGKLDLTGKNGTRLTVDYGQGSATGSITADGTTYMFSAPAVHRVPSARMPPGLYEATAVVDGTAIKAGWIVLPDGSQVGSVEYDPASSIPPTAQAPVLDLATGTASYDGVTLVASLISGITGSGF